MEVHEKRKLLEAIDIRLALKAIADVESCMEVSSESN